MAGVSLIGLGAMGLPMCAHLAHGGWEVTTFDLDLQRLAAASEAGAHAVRTAEEAASKNAVTLIVVSTPDQLLKLTDQVRDALLSGSVFIVHATVGVAAVEAVERSLAHRGVQLLDAPVSGGPARAGNGTLAMMVGGPPAAIESSLAVLRALATRIFTVGNKVGDGQRVKLINQLLAGVHIAAMAEALNLAERWGLELALVRDVIVASAGNSWMFEDRSPRAIYRTFAPPASAVRIWPKDLGLVVTEAEHLRTPVPLSRAALQMFQQATQQGLTDLDDASVLLTYESQSGT